MRPSEQTLREVVRKGLRGKLLVGNTQGATDWLDGFSLLAFAVSEDVDEMERVLRAIVEEVFTEVEQHKERLDADNPRGR